MARVKRGIISRARHKRLLKRTEGFRMTNNRLVKRASEADLHAGEYAFAGRKLRKRDMRSLWITRISGAAREMGLKYSVLINMMKKNNVTMDRKMLSSLIQDDNKAFKTLVGQWK